MRRQRTITALIAIAVLVAAATGLAVAAEPTAAVTGTYPIEIQAGGTGSIDIEVDLWGTVPKKPNRPAVINACTEATLAADGALSCDAFTTLNLANGHNYTQNKSDNLGNSFPKAFSVKINVESDVPCPDTYGVSLPVTSNPGSGVSFAGGVHEIGLYFEVAVTCPVASFDACGIGYWKNHTDNWPTGYASGDLVSKIFNFTDTSNPDVNALKGDTLLTALNYGGGSGVAGGARNLLRQAVAAALSAIHPDVYYPESLAIIQASVNTAIESLVRANMETVQNRFDGYEKDYVCPLTD